MAAMKELCDLDSNGKPVRTIKAALKTLKRLIDAGQDFSDAQWNASNWHNVSGDRLRDAYDKEVI